MPSVIVMPQDAPASKVAATRGYQQGQAGSEVVLYDRYTEDREAIGRRIAAERGMTLIPPYDHADVMAGQGTAALELIEDVGPLDALLVCVGGGGLFSGSAVAAHARSPGVKVYGVEPEAGNDVQQSVARGEIVHIDTPRTIADGAQTQACGQLTFPILRDLSTAILTVSDAQLVDDALLCRTHEDGGRAHRLPGRRGADGRRGGPEGPARGRHHQRRQRRPGRLRGPAVQPLS
jgi:threonine dehydratase